jgi:hypothetical protein
MLPRGRDPEAGELGKGAVDLAERVLVFFCALLFLFALCTHARASIAFARAGRDTY